MRHAVPWVTPLFHARLGFLQDPNRAETGDNTTALLPTRRQAVERNKGAAAEEPEKGQGREAAERQSEWDERGKQRSGMMRAGKGMAGKEAEGRKRG